MIISSSGWEGGKAGAASAWWPGGLEVLVHTGSLFIDFYILVRTSHKLKPASKLMIPTSSEFLPAGRHHR